MTRARGWSLWSLRMCIIFMCPFIYTHTHTHRNISERKYFVYKLSKKKTNERKDTQKKPEPVGMKEKLKCATLQPIINLKSEINRILSSATACVCVRLCKEHNIYINLPLSHTAVCSNYPRVLAHIIECGRRDAHQQNRCCAAHSYMMMFSSPLYVRERGRRNSFFRILCA